MRLKTIQRRLRSNMLPDEAIKEESWPGGSIRSYEDVVVNLRNGGSLVLTHHPPTNGELPERLKGAVR